MIILIAIRREVQHGNAIFSLFVTLAFEWTSLVVNINEKNLNRDDEVIIAPNSEELQNMLMALA